MREPADEGYRWRSEEASACRIHNGLHIHYLALTIEEVLSGRFAAFRLSDGSSDLHAYESHKEAVASVHDVDANMVLYLRIPPKPGPSVKECDVLLWYARKKYDAGYRPAGVHEGAELIIPARQELLRSPDTLLSRTDHNRRDRW